MIHQTLFLWKVVFMSKFLWVLLMQAGSWCGLFSLVLLVAEVLCAIVLKLRKSSVCKACLFCGAGLGGTGTEVRSWKELGRELMFGCIIRLFIPRLRTGMNRSAPPFLKVIKKWFSGVELWLALCYVQVFLLLRKKSLLTALFARQNTEVLSNL